MQIMFFLERTVKQLMVVEWLSGKRSYDNHGFVAHVLTHQNEGAFVCMSLSNSVQSMPSWSHSHKTLKMTLHMSTVSSHIMDHCETVAPDECCKSGTVDACLSSHETTPLLLRCSRMHIPSHHHKPLCHYKCPHNNESIKSVCEGEVGMVTHATQMTTVLSSCQSHHHWVCLVFHHCHHTDTHSFVAVVHFATTFVA